VFALFWGCGTGLYGSVASSLLTRLFDDTGQALGFHVTGGSLAGLAAPIAATYVAVRLGWRSAVGLDALLAFTALGFVAWWYRSTPPRSLEARIRERIAPSTVVDLLADRGILYSIMIASLGVFTWQSVTSFLPTFLIEYRGLSTQLAATAFGVVFLVSALGQPVMGRVSDSVGRDVVLAACTSVTAVALVLFFGPSDSRADGNRCTVARGGITWFAAIQARIMDRPGGEERGTGFGLVRTVYMLVGSSGSVVTGTLADVAGWETGFGLP